ncbi:MAG: hypothetical protein E7500_07780 [Ruminococcus sp.]|nr:hypothetical protein [Ruminococcus sp.]
MNRLNDSQLLSLLLVTDAFALICFMGDLSVISVAGFVLGAVFRYLLYLPIAEFYQKGGTLKSSSALVKWFCLIYIILWGGLLFVMLWNASEAVTIPAEYIPFIPENLVISGLIALTCLYVSSPGEKALSRASLIASALGAICISIVILSAVPRFRIAYLEDIPQGRDIISGLFTGFVIGGGSGALTVLLGFTKGDAKRLIRRYFTAQLILLAVVSLTVIMVTGGIDKVTDFPVITAVTLSQPFSTQRIDALFLIIFVILAVFSISVQTVTASYLLSRLYPDFRRFRSSFVLLAIIATAFFLSSVPVYAPVTGALTLIAPFGILTELLRRRKRGKV